MFLLDVKENEPDSLVALVKTPYQARSKGSLHCLLIAKGTLCLGWESTGR